MALSPDLEKARARVAVWPRASLGALPTPIEPMERLARAVHSDAHILIKRDDAIPFGFGGNKIRKLSIVAADALKFGADTLITCGGVQSNHARATAATAARLGMRCILIANGTPQSSPTANALLDRLLGAEIRYVADRTGRVPGMEAAAEELRHSGHRPYVIPLGASTPLGSLGFAQAVGEILAQGVTPDVIVHASSSAGTQAGLIAGCALHGLTTRIIGVNADGTRDELRGEALKILAGMETMLGLPAGALEGATRFEADDSFVGEGYAIPSDPSREAQALAARTEALFVDHTYTAKAFAAFLARLRDGRIGRGQTALFWHTGGQVGLFA